MHSWGCERSKQLYIHEDKVCTSFEHDDLVWVVPHLLPADLEHYAGGKLQGVRHVETKPSQKKAKSAAKKPNEQSNAFAPYVLDAVKVSYSSQGSSNPIIKVQVRQDRNDTKSKWVQRMQVVIKDEVSKNIAWNVAKTFADCFQFMGLVPDVTNYRECRDSLLAYGAAGYHDFEKGPLPWRTVADKCLKAFPPKSLGSPTSVVPTDLYAL